MSAGTFCVRTNCCAVQRHETYRIAEYFRRNGWTETGDAAAADAVVVTTCGVTDAAERAALDEAARVFAEKKPGCRVFLSGCLPNICPDRLRERFPESVRIPLDRLSLFDAAIGASVPIESIAYHAGPPLHHSAGDPTLEAGRYDAELTAARALADRFGEPAFLDAYNYCTQGRYLWKDDSLFEIKVSSGCARACSYCASRKGIGAYRSRPSEQIVSEVRQGAALGYRNIMLMGDELGDYGIDTGESLPSLLRSCLAADGGIRLGVRYLHPDALLAQWEELLPLFDRIFFLCVSVQSANGEVLAGMNRSDNIARLTERLRTLRARFPRLYLHTQIIVGFPNETGEAFRDTLRFLDACEFDFIRVNVFSPREGTPAYGMKPCYSPAELADRMERMRRFCEDNRYRRLYRRYVDCLRGGGRA